MIKNLFKRDIVDQILEYINTDELLVLHGARQVGKSSILFWLEDYLKQKNQKVFYIDLEDSRFVRVLDQGVDEFLKLLQEEGVLNKQSKKENKLYVFIDEIQYLKNPSSFLKLIADHHKYLKLVVSGSSSFEIKSKFKDSLVGRSINFEIFNLSFSEFLLFKNYFFDAKTSLTIKKQQELKKLYKEYVLYGGYPKIVLTSKKEHKEKYLQQIIDTYVRQDIRDLAEIKDLEKFNKLLEALASQSGSMLQFSELSNTCNLAVQTVEKYLFILENTYILKLVRPYHKILRSELFKTPKIFFYDTGLMQMLWLKELPKTIMGNVFETSVFAEFVKKYLKDNIYYWRTKDKKEIDFIVKSKNKILPVEVKLNLNKFNAKTLQYFNKYYQIKKYKVVGLEGEKKENSVFPWEL